MRLLKLFVPLCLLITAFTPPHPIDSKEDNPFLVASNVPVDYAKVKGYHLEEYANVTSKDVLSRLAKIKSQKSPTFKNVFVAMDDVNDKVRTTSSTCFMFYWVSTDSLSRAKGLAANQMLDSLSTTIYSDKALYKKMQQFVASAGYKQLKGKDKNLVDDMMMNFKQSGVNLDAKKQARFKKLSKEINKLSSEFATNMNTASDKLTLDEEGAQGLPEKFKATYKVAENKYEIPIINSTKDPVMNNADKEATRKAYSHKLDNRGAGENLAILDELVKKRHELGVLMGYKSFADYKLSLRMAKNPTIVWSFLNDLVERSKVKAQADIALLQNEKKKTPGNKISDALQPWDIGYYRNQLLKNEYKVDAEKLREYLPMKESLQGMFEIYQNLLGLQFKKVNNASVWHPEVEMYNVYEGNKLKGRFYLDLFPRPNKETWFYCVPLNSGKAKSTGYEVPVAMLLGNFTKPTATLPSLLSHGELRTLFHEFGHIVNAMSYHGDYSSQADTKDDFGESMSQIFENWIWDYETLRTFAKHYKTGEVLPKEMFDNMVKAKNITSGLTAIGKLRSAFYDMNLYNKYDPAKPVATDQLWQNIDQELGVMPMYVSGTHPQASWIHINTHPTYYYGYLWSEVYAQDMFTAFKKNGLTDKETGRRYREMILANGTQRDVVEAVEAFLQRKSNNEAYIKSLGLD